MRFGRGAIALSITLLSHFALVPLLAIYGIHVCPILYEKGFSFGCTYNFAFVTASIAISAIVNLFVLWILETRTQVPRSHWTLRDFSWISSVIHLLIFGINISILRNYLTSLQMPGPSLIRMSAAFAIAAILLSLLQGEAFSWAIQGWLRTSRRFKSFDSTEDLKSNASLLMRRWLISEFSRTAPFCACIAVILVYGYSKILEFKDLYGVDDDFLYSRSSEAFQILGLTLGWLLIVEFIKMRKDSEVLMDIGIHVDQISKGKIDHFSREIASGIWREIFQILNRMTRTMAQRMRLIKGLSAYAAEQVVEKILSKDALQTFGSRKRVSILMSDLRGFTEMANRLSPEHVVQILNLYFETMVEVCARHDLIVDKFIGDGMLAYADSAVGTSEMQSEKAIRAAFEMLESLNEVNGRLRTMGFHDLKIGIGLHFGDVIQGSIGTKNRLQHTIIGDAVNMAARLEAKCKELRTDIVASGAIVHMAGHHRFENLRLYGPVEISGVDLPIEVFTPATHVAIVSKVSA